MNHHKQRAIHGLPHRYPSFFRLAVPLIQDRNSQRIDKNGRRLLKAYTVFLAILVCLARIPIEIVIRNGSLPWTPRKYPLFDTDASYQRFSGPATRRMASRMKYSTWYVLRSVAVVAFLTTTDV
jgi:hypothetical protein